MKKQFMKTTALVGAALIGGAGAAAQAQTNKPVISVGGYYEGDIGLPLKNRADDTATLDYHAESEVHFNGSVKLDNGMSIRVRWELEGDADGSPGPGPGSNGGLTDVIDEAYMTISGSFGQLILGSTDNAPTKMVTGYMGSWPTSVGQNHAFDAFEWTATPSTSPFPPNEFATTRDSRANAFDGDAEKISYFTPRISGVQLGFSYTPNTTEQTTNDASGLADAADAYHDGLAFGANWTGKFEAASVGIAGGYVTFSAPHDDDDNENATLWTAAMRVDAGPVRIAGGYKTINNGASRPEGRLFDLGVRYTMGPNRMSLTYTNGKADDTDNKVQAAMLGYARTLGPGTRWHANLIYNKSRILTGLDDNDNPVTNKDSGWAVSTGVRVNF